MLSVLRVSYIILLIISIALDHKQIKKYICRAE